ncbi:hypothetical protein J6590_104319 [Homalodisca vitripennis]|nr:hypothetical protein J6590_104319 [Homalodisca vitripennis]
MVSARGDKKVTAFVCSKSPADLPLTHLTLQTFLRRGGTGYDSEELKGGDASSIMPRLSEEE